MAQLAAPYCGWRGFAPTVGGQQVRSCDEHSIVGVQGVEQSIVGVEQSIVGVQGVGME